MPSYCSDDVGVCFVYDCKMGNEQWIKSTMAEQQQQQLQQQESAW